MHNYKYNALYVTFNRGSNSMKSLLLASTLLIHAAPAFAAEESAAKYFYCNDNLANVKIIRISDSKVLEDRLIAAYISQYECNKAIAQMNSGTN